MKLMTVCILCFSCTFFYLAGQNTQKMPVTQQPASELQSQLMNERISTLMADRVVVNKEIPREELAVIDGFLQEELDDLLEYESMMFPADELYGYWDTTWVNPYRNKEITYPDTFAIDCTTFVYPLDDPIKVTSLFGVRSRRMHNGIDLKVQKGDTVRSAFSGKVRIKGFERRGFGNYLVIRHQNGLETVYGHLSGFLVSDNDIVIAGQPIGLGGNTGRSTGTHLHFETRFLGQALNPSHIIDFTNGGVPHNDQYVLYKGDFGKNTNIYTSTTERIVYHRVKQGETLGKIALQYRTSVAELCRLNGLTQKSVLRIGQTLRCGTTIEKTASKETVAAVTETPAGQGQATAAYHTVQAQETLSSIARLYTTTVDALCRLNNIQSTTPLKIGQEICYRAASKPVALPKESLPEDAGGSTNESSLVIASVSDQLKTEEIKKPEEEKSNHPSLTSQTTQTTKTSQTSQPVYYRIKEGDTLSSIAQRHGITINKLCELNNITKTTILRIGRSLRCS